MVIHNPKVGGSIPPPRPPLPLITNNYENQFDAAMLMRRCFVEISPCGTRLAQAI
jgi:hypothetical protein